MDYTSYIPQSTDSVDFIEELPTQLRDWLIDHPNPTEDPVWAVNTKCLMTTGNGIPIAHLPVTRLTEQVRKVNTIDKDYVEQSASITPTHSPKPDSSPPKPDNNNGPSRTPPPDQTTSMSKAAQEPPQQTAPNPQSTTINEAEQHSPLKGTISANGEQNPPFQQDGNKQSLQNNDNEPTSSNVQTAAAETASTTIEDIPKVLNTRTRRVGEVIASIINSEDEHDDTVGSRSGSGSGGQASILSDEVSTTGGGAGSATRGDHNVVYTSVDGTADTVSSRTTTASVRSSGDVKATNVLPPLEAEGERLVTFQLMTLTFGLSTVLLLVL